MKQIFAILLTISMLLCLAACEGGTAGTTPATTQPAQTTQPTEHIHNYGVQTKDATCTEAGLNTFLCACGHSYTEEIPAAGHSWSSWEVESLSVLGKPGSQSRTCSVCSEKETQENTENTIANSFSDGGLQYLIVIGDGSFSPGALLCYARHEFHEYMYTVTPAETIFARLGQHFDLTEDMKNEIRGLGSDAAVYGSTEYDPAADTFALEYNAEQGNFFFLGYVPIEGNRYATYYSFSEFGYEEAPVSYWKIELEYHKAEGLYNKYLSCEKVESVPADLIPCEEN